VVAEREREAYRLRLLGYTPEEIGERFGVSDRMARKYIAAGREQAAEELRRLEGSAGVAHRYEVLRTIEEESLAAWERSKRERKVRTAGVESAGAGELEGVVRKRSVQRVEEMIGDPAFLNTALRANAEIRALIGLDAPTVKRLLVGTDPATAGDDDYADLPTEELLRRYREAVGLGEEME
jgi:transposase